VVDPMRMSAPLSWQTSPQGVANDNVARTVGEVIAAGSGLVATCEVCLHSERLNLHDLAARFGAEHGLAALRPKLQCSVCKSIDASLCETHPERHCARPQKAKIPVPEAV
jgi:hypothetical protein